METKFTITKRDKKATIYFTFYRDKQMVRINSSLKCNLNDWHKGQLKRVQRTSELRKWLTDYKQRIDSQIRELSAANGRQPTKSELVAICDTVTGSQAANESQTVGDLISKYLVYKVEVQRVRYGTIKQQRTHLAHFSYQCGHLSTLDLNKVELQRYKETLTTQGYEVQTVNSYLKDVKAFLHWLFDNDLTTSNLSVYLKKEKEHAKPVIALTESEIEQLEQHTFTPRLQRVVDLFLLCCYTGLRVSDLMQFDSNKIQKGRYHFRQTKTSGIIKLPLIDEAKELIDKYKGELPKISEQKGRDYLKEAFTVASIDRLVPVTEHKGNKPIDSLVPLYKVASWHLARKSFVSIALSKGMTPNAVMAVTGHTGYRTMKKYIDVQQAMVDDQMTNLFSRRGGKMKAI